MKNKLLKLINILLIFVLLFPISKVSAAETWNYMHYAIKLSEILGNVPVKGSYQLNGNRYIHIESQYVSGGPAVFWIHEINDGTNYYHGYCLHAGYSVRDGVSVTLHKDFSDLKSAYDNQLLTENQRELLENILASGYQNGIGAANGTIFRVTGTSRECRDITACRKIFATQLLIWEVMDYARTSYNLVPDINPPTSPYNSIVNAIGNESLKTEYENILKEAKNLTTEGSIPSGLVNDTVTLRWNDNTGKYESGLINIGEYNYYDTLLSSSITKDTKLNSDSYNIEVTSKDSNNNVKISSNSYISYDVDIQFRLTKGSLNKDSLSFRWFEFPKQSNKRDYQDVLLGDYQKTFDRNLTIKTEEGKVKFTKIDSQTNKLLKGAVFELRKCGPNQTSCNYDIQKIDLTSTAEKEINLKKSGWYLLVETKTPEGYEKLPDTYLQFNIENGRANLVSYTSQGKIKKDNDASKLVLINDAKEISINKIDGKSLTPVNGASFQIKDSSGNIVKFTDVNNVYRYSKEGTITDIYNSNLSTYKISLLPAGDYTITETSVPHPYTIPSNIIDRETKIRIDKEYNLYVYNKTSKKYERSSNASVTIKNYKTKVIIEKTGNGGNPLSGVVFELYNSEKTSQVALTSLGNGVYECNPNSTNFVQLVTNEKGTITINYLPEGTYYLKEVKTVDGYKIDPSVEWRKIEISVTGNNPGSPINVKISNAKGEFCFYKIDEDGNYLDDGLFKLQVYNETTSKFEDTPLIFNETSKTYTIDEKGESDIYTFSPISEGKTCFTDMNSKGRYRVVEIEAPEGFILPKVSEMNAEITINENGYAIGDAVIINKKITIGEGAEAQAELIVNISTGQDRIHYIVIICSLLVIITGLIILTKKINKK